MIKEPKSVFVLGAGFTKAFLPTAPLLVDFYDISHIIKKYEHFRHAHYILEKEFATRQDGKINIEQLMTRLDSGMPYDLFHGAREELLLLLSDIKIAFKNRLSEARLDAPPNYELKKALGAFALYCLATRSFCVTFNYDDILDEVLWQISQITRPSHSMAWNPNNGYGFFCRSAPQVVWGGWTGMAEPSSSLVLKLHGSVNWYIRLGYISPYSIDAIAHSEDWCSNTGISDETIQQINIHLESEPFIVPPVLMKSSLVEQPIIRLLWEIAYDSLRLAKEITFIGYSLPITDIAATFLFRESIRPNTRIKVINFAETEEEKAMILSSYRKVFDDLDNESLEIGGACKWCNEYVLSRVLRDERMKHIYESYCKRISSSS